MSTLAMRESPGLADREKRIFRAKTVPDTGIDLRRGKHGGVKGYHWKPNYKPPITVRVPYPDLKYAWCRPMSIAFAERKVPTINEIQLATCSHYRIRWTDLIGRRRSNDVVRPRQIAYWLAKNLTLSSYPQIGRRFHRDHTTVLSGVRKIDDLIRRDDAVKAAALAISKSLGIDDCPV